jgi:hypothetical protein
MRMRKSCPARSLYSLIGSPVRLEDFALGQFIQARHEAATKRMPRHLGNFLIGIDEKRS